MCSDIINHASGKNDKVELKGQFTLLLIVTGDDFCFAFTYVACNVPIALFVIAFHRLFLGKFKKA